MKKICFPRIRKGYGKLVSVLRRRGARKRTEQLPEVLIEAERYEDEQLAMKQHEAVQCEDERCENEQLAVMQHEAMQRGAEGCENEQFAVMQREAMQREDEQRENEHHGKSEACNQKQCPLREFCLKKFSEKRDVHAAGDASPDKAKR